MIVWSGKGIFPIILIVLLAVLSVSVLPENIADYGIIASFFITALFCWIMGRRWNAKSAKNYIDADSGKKVDSSAAHSLFWIKMENWAYIFGLLGLISIVRLFI